MIFFKLEIKPSYIISTFEYGHDTVLLNFIQIKDNTFSTFLIVNVACQVAIQISSQHIIATILHVCETKIQRTLNIP